MSRKPWGAYCPVCKRMFALKRDGFLRKHKPTPLVDGRPTAICPGSDCPPVLPHSERDKQWKLALREWTYCSARRLSWLSGEHCTHCNPLRMLLGGFKVLG